MIHDKELLEDLGEARSFDHAMQERVAEATQRPLEVNEGIAALLIAHDIEPNKVRPEAAPDEAALATLTDKDWADVATTPEPFVALWSHANRNRIRRFWESLERTELETGDIENIFLRAMPVTQSTTVDSLNLAVKSGGFLSNRTLHDKDVDMRRRGHTYAEDRELGLDGKVFLDFGRPHTGRMGDNQTEVIVVFEPEVMNQPGSFVTQNDIMFDEAIHGSIQPEAYMREILTVEDFYTTAAQIIKMKTSEYRDPQTLAAYARGEDSNFNQYGAPSFSTFEVKVPHAQIHQVRHIIFRDQATCDAFTAEHGDAFKTMVVPDVKAALLRGEDVMGTYAIVERAKKEIEEADYQKRVEKLTRVPEAERTTTYIVVPDNATVTFNPEAEPYTGESPTEALRHLRQLNHIRANALTSLGHDDPYELIKSARVARVVSGAGVSVIEAIEEHSL